MRRASLPILLGIASASAFPVSSVNPLTVDTPETVKQCAPTTFTWSSTIAPYYLTVIDSSSQPTFDEDSTTMVIPTAHSATWVVDLPAGSSITVVVRDSTGAIAETLPRVVGEGSSRCLDDGLVF